MGVTGNDMARMSEMIDAQTNGQPINKPEPMELVKTTEPEKPGFFAKLGFGG